jgi:hypothetical protein
MYNRICIVCLPRSGSSWLEQMIHNAHLHSSPKSVLLGEYFNYYAFYKNKADAEFNIGDDNFLNWKWQTIKEDTSKSEVSEDKFYQDRLEMLKKINPNQNIVLRMMMGWDHYNYEEYIQELINLNFKIISLSRNIFDQLISQVVSMETNYHHSHSKFAYPNLKIKEITINEKEFKDYLTMFKTEDNLRKNLAIKFNSPIIRYCNLIEDCNSNNIPINQNVTMVKTYPLSYSNYIKNYNELKELYERSN